MITEDYVSFETAILLKEKGFDEYCSQVYAQHPCHDEPIVMLNDATTNSKGVFGAVFYSYASAPTLQMAMKWLREKHNQNITVKAHNNIARLKTIYYAEVQNLSEPAEKGFCVNGCTFKDTYEEACEAAIKYCLENLI